MNLNIEVILNNSYEPLGYMLGGFYNCVVNVNEIKIIKFI